MAGARPLVIGLIVTVIAGGVGFALARRAKTVATPVAVASSSAVPVMVAGVLIGLPTRSGRLGLSVRFDIFKENG